MISISYESFTVGFLAAIGIAFIGYALRGAIKDLRYKYPPSQTVSEWRKTLESPPLPPPPSLRISVYESLCEVRKIQESLIKIMDNLSAYLMPVPSKDVDSKCRSVPNFYEQQVKEHPDWATRGMPVCQLERGHDGPHICGDVIWENKVEK